MEILFVRHAEPDYSSLDAHPEYRGFGRDLAPLSQLGRKQAQKVAENPIFQTADVVIASSVTRALETASYIAFYNDLPLLVEPLFHEWLPDKTGQNNSAHESAKAYQEFLKYDGKPSKNPVFHYETKAEIKARFLGALEKYQSYQKIIIVTHGVLMRQFVDVKEIAYTQVISCKL